MVKECEGESEGELERRGGEAFSPRTWESNGKEKEEEKKAGLASFEDYVGHWAVLQ